MDKVIVTTHWRRPKYSQQVLDALLRCDGVQDYSIIAHLDADGDPAVREVVHRFAVEHGHTKMVEHPIRQGCSRNIHNALADGFALTDYVILIEDDVVPGVDCLRYFEWARQFGGQADIFTVAAYRNAKPTVSDYDKVIKEHWFTPWGWATWRDRYDELLASTQLNHSDSWDMQTNRIRGERVQLVPLLARTQNIGAELGMYCPGPVWHRENQFNEFGVWSVSPDQVGPFVLE